MIYEKDRLIKLGLHQLSPEWVANRTDHEGYDILSYDLDEHKQIVQIYIEVKTTSMKKDCPFFISRKEVEVSNKYDICYRIYRIYNVENETPGFYIVSGKIEDHFRIDPVSYLAELLP